MNLVKDFNLISYFLSLLFLLQFYPQPLQKHSILFYFEMEQQCDYINKYRVQSILDEGAQGKVYMVTHQNKCFAAKVYLVSEDHRAQSYIEQQYEHQIRTLQRLKGGDNLISMVQFDREGTVKISQISQKQINRPIIIMELAERGQLIQYIMQAGKLSPESSKRIFRMILSAVKFMDSQGLTHRDLKPENTLFNTQFQVKVGDFGHATVSKNHDQYIIHKETTEKPRKGTRVYRLPAIQLYEPYTGIEADIYAAGMTYFVLATGVFPYGSLAANDIHYKLIKAQKFDKYWNLIKRQLPNHEEIITPDFKKLIQSIFVCNKKLTIDELIGLKWLNDYKQPYQQYKREMTSIFDEILAKSETKRKVQSIRVKCLKEKIEKGQYLNIKDRSSSQFFSCLHQFLALELSSLNFQQSKNTYETPFVKCKPSFLLAWVKEFLFLHFNPELRQTMLKIAQKDQSGELNLRMQKINCFTGSIEPQITQFNVKPQENTIKLQFQIQFETQNQPQTMSVQLEGRLVRKAHSIKQVEQSQIMIGIEWDQKSYENFYAASLIKHIDNHIRMIEKN